MAEGVEMVDRGGVGHGGILGDGGEAVYGVATGNRSLGKPEAWGPVATNDEQSKGYFAQGISPCCKLLPMVEGGMGVCKALCRAMSSAVYEFGGI